MKLFIENRQKVLKIDRRELKRLANAFAEYSGVVLGEVTLIIVDDEGCAPINVAAVGHEGATDVITLYYEAIPGDDEGASAEIIINAECAMRERPDEPFHELSYYLAHAFNHLSGRDDDTPKKRTAMHRRERAWLRRALSEQSSQ